jgi:hypothetical protein
MADIAIANGHKKDMVAARSPHRAAAACLDLAIIGVGAEADDTQFAIVRREGDPVDGRWSEVGDKPEANDEADEFWGMVEEIGFHRNLSSPDVGHDYDNRKENTAIPQKNEKKCWLDDPVPLDYSRSTTLSPGFG